MSARASEYARGISSLIDYRHQRSWPAAAGFYLTYLAIGVSLGMVLIIVGSAILAPHISSYEESYSFGVTAGRFISMLYVGSILALVIFKRDAWRNIIYVACLGLTVILAYFSGVMGGLVPATLLLALKGPEREKTKP